MTYLESFKFPDKYAEEDFRLSLLSTYHDIWYPFGVLSNHKIEFIKFDDLDFFFLKNEWTYYNFNIIFSYLST